MSELEERRFSVGYALAPKKVHSFIQPSLIEHAKSQGIYLIAIDPTKPLIEQGPFDVLIHKLYDQDWKQQLIQFSSGNPNVPIIDPPDSIVKLHNRISMLEVVSQLKTPPHDQTFAIPKQVVIDNSESLSDPINAMRGLKFPVIAKTLVADGSATSHKMSLVFNGEGLSTPIVLQEFVSHGGVLFKVYVVGEFVKCVKRRSLSDISPEKMGTLGGLLSFSQISNLTYQEQGQDSDLDRHLEEAELPPLSFVEDIASGLRQAMKLNLFNFDMIRDTNDGNRYIVIDINYFPGYEKMPSYETVLTDFFRQIVHKKQSGERVIRAEDDKKRS